MQSINRIKYLFLGLLLFSINSIAQEPTIGIRAGAPIIPTGDFPSHIANKGYGGYHVTDDKDDISSYLRTQGMMVYDTSDNNTYILESDLVTWTGWSTRVGALEGNTNNWNTAYGWGNWADNVGPTSDVTFKSVEIPPYGKIVPYPMSETLVNENSTIISGAGIFNALRSGITYVGSNSWLYVDSGNLYYRDELDNTFPMHTALQTTISSVHDKAATPGAVEDYAHPLETQRLGPTNDVTFNSVTLTNAVYVASGGTGDGVALDGLRFYDTGETHEGEKLYLDETGTYYNYSNGAAHWIICAIVDSAVYVSYPFFYTTTTNPVGTYIGAGGATGTVTISEMNLGLQDEVERLYTKKQSKDNTLTILSGRGRSYPVFQFNLMYWEVTNSVHTIALGTEVELKASTNNFATTPFQYWGDSMNTNLTSYITFANSDTNCVFYYSDYSGGADQRPLARLDMADMMTSNTMLTDYIGSATNRAGFHQYIYMIPDAGDSRFTDWMYEANDENISWMWRPRTTTDEGPKDADGYLIWWPIRPSQWVTTKSIGGIE